MTLDGEPVADVWCAAATTDEPGWRGQGFVQIRRAGQEGLTLMRGLVEIREKATEEPVNAEPRSTLFEVPAIPGGARGGAAHDDRLSAARPSAVPHRRGPALPGLHREEPPAASGSRLETPVGPTAPRKAAGGAAATGATLLALPAGLAPFRTANGQGWRYVVTCNGYQLTSERRTRIWAASVAEGWVDVVAVDAKGFAREEIRRNEQGRITSREPICDRYYGEVIIRRKAGL